MKALRQAAALVAGTVAALALSMSATAQGGGIVAGEETAALPGITVTGIGFAQPGASAYASSAVRQRATDAASPTAVARAAHDARLRARAIAGALGVQLGAPTDVELRDLDQFTRIRGCAPGAARKTVRCRRPSLKPAAVTMTFAIVGGAAAPSAVRALGAASVPIRPADATRNQPIRTAVFAARGEATQQAAVAARGNALRAARAAGLSLGALVSVSEAAPPLYFGPIFGSSGFYDPALGSFGPGQFCGLVTRAVVKTDPQDGHRHIIRRVRGRHCRPGTEYSVSLRIGYAAG